MPDLSVLIPVYRYDASVLLDALLKQSEALQQQIEIIVFDDSANVAYHGWHQRFSSFHTVRFETNAQNQGRSKVRNALLGLASAPWSLFLDGDMQIPTGFLGGYLDMIEEEAIFCGGICTELTPVEASSLRGKYSRAVEQKSAVQRTKHPYRSFTAANFMMPTAWAVEVRFPESYTGYGHEDTHFGLQLMDLKKPIRHFDLPAKHLGIDSDAVFIDKTRAAVESLVLMFIKEPLFSKYTNEIKLINAWILLRSTGLLLFIARFAGFLEKGLKKRRFGLTGLKLFKLAWFERSYRANASS